MSLWERGLWQPHDDFFWELSAHFITKIFHWSNFRRGAFPAKIDYICCSWILPFGRLILDPPNLNIEGAARDFLDDSHVALEMEHGIHGRFLESSDQIGFK